MNWSNQTHRTPVVSKLPFIWTQPSWKASRWTRCSWLVFSIRPAQTSSGKLSESKVFVELNRSWSSFPGHSLRLRFKKSLHVESFQGTTKSIMIIKHLILSKIKKRVKTSSSSRPQLSCWSVVLWEVGYECEDFGVDSKPFSFLLVSCCGAVVRVDPENTSIGRTAHLENVTYFIHCFQFEKQHHCVYLLFCL